MAAIKDSKKTVSIHVLLIIYQNKNYCIGHIHNKEYISLLVYYWIKIVFKIKLLSSLI